MKLINGDVSLCLGAFHANVFLLDNQHMSLLYPRINLKVVLSGKSKTEEEKVLAKENSHRKHIQNYENLMGIGLDCRVDKDPLQY